MNERLLATAVYSKATISLSARSSNRCSGSPSQWS